MNRYIRIDEHQTVLRILVRAVGYTIHGLIPASCVFADRYNREEVGISNQYREQ